MSPVAELLRVMAVIAVASLVTGLALLLTGSMTDGPVGWDDWIDQYNGRGSIDDDWGLGALDEAERSAA